MNQFLTESRFEYITAADKAFIYAFDAEMGRLGYDFGASIGSGYCWGKYMLIYRKRGVKSDQVYARIYLREKSTVLRLFLNDIDRHRSYVEQLPAYLKEVFTGPQGQCQKCHNDKAGCCRFRKSYILDQVLYEKCSGIVFEFHEPNVDKIPDYLGLFTEFFPQKNRVQVITAGE